MLKHKKLFILLTLIFTFIYIVDCMAEPALVIPDNVIELPFTYEAPEAAGAVAESGALAPAVAAVVGERIVRQIVSDYVAGKHASSEDVDLLTQALSTYVNTANVADDLNPMLMHPLYMAHYVTSGENNDPSHKLRVAISDKFFDKLFNAFGDYVSENADENGVVHLVSPSGDLTGYSTDLNVVIDAINDYAELRIGRRPFIGGRDLFSRVPNGLMFFEACYNSQVDILTARCVDIDYNIANWGPLWFSPGSSGSADWYGNDGATEFRFAFSYDAADLVGIGSSSDVAIDDDFINNLSDLLRDFKTQHVTNYNYNYAPSGVEKVAPAVALDVDLETDSNGDLVLDDDGVPVVAPVPVLSPAISTTLQPWVVDDPETLNRLLSQQETAPDNSWLTDDAETNQNIFWSKITGFFKSFWLNLYNILLSVLRAVFVPSADEIKGVFYLLKGQFEASFGVSFVDLSTLFGEGHAPENLYMDFDFLGIACFHLKVVDMDVFIYIVGIFRALIRGLLTLWLILYNINQFFHLIGAGDLALGSVREFQAAQSGVPPGRVRGDMIRAKYGGD